MKTLISAIFILVLGIAASAEAAIYAKYDGVDGSSISVSSETSITTSSGVVGKSFILDGSKSVDDETIRTFSWTQVSGPTVALGNTASFSVTPKTAGTYVFDLIVVDTNGRASVAARRTFTVDAEGPTVRATPITGDPDFDLLPTSGTPTDPQEGRTDAFLEIKGVEGETAKGKVEYEWKVEEGESAAPGAANDRLETAGPSDGWPGEAKGGVSVAAGDIDGLTDAEKAAFLASVRAHAEARSEQDLENFARGVLLDDPQMEQISLNFEKIEFRYRSSAKLFGFIPVGMSAIITADIGAESSSDRIAVKFPWWSFIATNDFDIDGFHSAAVSKIDSITIKQGVKTQGEVLLEISALLKTRHESATE